MKRYDCLINVRHRLRIERGEIAEAPRVNAGSEVDFSCYISLHDRLLGKHAKNE